MPLILMLLFSQVVFATSTAENCLRNFPFPLDSDGQAEVVGDSIIVTGENGALIVHRPRGSVTVSADGVRCNGTSGNDQGSFAYLAKILKKRSSSKSPDEKVKLRIAAKECWNLSAGLNDAISSVREVQKMTDLQERSRFGEATN